ncbi:MAG TPA: protein-disulfide reductase DsbD domain-containing protein [Thermohalobaculum sp.]|nr:protein-disulfide reductase DsbD domain-containing protein [Thermohalobaculum sp.]
MVFAALVFLPVLAPDSVLSQAVVSTGESFVQVSLLPGRAEPDGARMIGLVVDIAPHWKTYWRNPGAAGIPPQFDWSKSRNLGSAEVFWPRPGFFDSFGLTTLGYSGQVVFPVRLVPSEPGQAIEIDLGLALGVCRDICVLEETAVQARIEPGAPDSGGAALAVAERAVPRSGTDQGMVTATCRISGAGKKRLFDAELEFAGALTDPVVILEGPDMIWFTGVETAATPGTGRLQVAAGLSLLDETVWIDRSQVRMTVLAGDFAADIKGCIAPAG